MSELVSATPPPPTSASDASRHIPKDPATVEYGSLHENLPNVSKLQTYYITTAIAYTNGYPHMGHAYEFLTADVLARFHRVMGYDTFFLTGSDEHGQKVAASAAASGRSPLDHCDIYVDAFKALNQRLAISCSDYQRTTDPYHEDTARKLWCKCADAGDIYLDSYEGWYNEREEVFVPDADAEAANFLDPGSGVPLKRVSEESYFFRMSKYTDRLLAYLEENPTFIEPEQYRNNILVRLRKEGLRDLSISRTTFSWGISMPPAFDQRHVMYVWFDALTNYLTGVHGLDPDDELRRYWPANRHIIGKDIIWFHCVIWPCMLMSAGIPLPAGVFSHGFVNAADGRKMSKSYNNAIDPHEMLDKYPLDSIRYYLCSAVTYGADLSFSEASLVTMHNSELADILGNLVHRVLNLCQKYCDGLIPNTVHDTGFSPPFDMEALLRDWSIDASACAINLALFKAMEAARATNRYLTEAEPWKMKGEAEARRPAIVRLTLEAVYAFMHILAPVIPMAAKAVFKHLGTPPVALSALKSDFYNLTPGTRVTVGDILFQKIESGDMSTIPEPIIKKVGNKATSDVVVEDPNQLDFSKMDFRVGKIVKVWHHETADRLFCEEIDIGEELPRAVASGLRQYYTLEQMHDRLVIVACNLKETKLQGFMSFGMVLAAKVGDVTTGGKMVLLEPPTGSVVGERVYIEGLRVGDVGGGPPLTAARIKKLKVWESVSADLSTDNSSIACWKGRPLLTTIGPVVAPQAANSPIA